MPRLWDRTIETHRREVREAILDTTWALVVESGLRAVTMSQIAAQAGIGRATLYKYFSDVEAILAAWHQRHVADHLGHFADLAAQGGRALDRLEAVLLAYAISHHHRGRHAPELETLLHRNEDVAHAHHQLRELLRGLLTEAAASGDLRRDVAPDELTLFCLHAVSGAGSLPDEGAVRRLVMVALTALRPPAQVEPA